ncbi:MAG TPA: AAA family ATPase [Parafilimonas sp.]|nr:AAA family ATPase [Parafilimonas sp.]
MQLQQAERKRVKLRLNIAAPSGFGKTYSALLIAYGITNDWSKIAVIDTENDSASLYSHLGQFKTLQLKAPYSCERYIEAIKICEDADMDVIIIDSITHVWKGQGGLLEYQNALGGRYQDWAKATPLYQKWLNKILQSSAHVITTNRKKQGYNMITEGNKTKVEKAGLDDEIRDGYEYEMTIALEITNDKHMARASKDRTGLFTDKPEFIITVETGRKILAWCIEGKPSDMVERINDCKSLDELLKLYYQNPTEDKQLLGLYSARKKEFEKQLSTSKSKQNGIHHTTTTRQ